MAARFKRCSVSECNGNAHSDAFGAKGYCRIHYYYFRKSGDPLKRSTIARGEAQRFITEVAIPFSGDECLLWPFAKMDNGRGMVQHNGKPTLTNRAVCEAVYGSAPSDIHEAAHSCGNGHLSCVNPRHLRWATPLENQDDKDAHGTAFPTAKLTVAQVAEILSLKGAATQKQIAARFNVSQPTVSAIHRGARWVRALAKAK